MALSTCHTQRHGLSLCNKGERVTRSAENFVLSGAAALIAEKRRNRMATGNTKGKREAIWPSDVPRPMLPYSPAIKAGGWVFVSGQVATDGKTGVPAEAQVDPESPYLDNQLEREGRYIMKNLAAPLKAAGGDTAQDAGRIY